MRIEVIAHGIRRIRIGAAPPHQTPAMRTARVRGRRLARKTSVHGRANWLYSGTKVVRAPPAPPPPTFVSPATPMKLTSIPAARRLLVALALAGAVPFAGAA